MKWLAGCVVLGVYVLFCAVFWSLVLLVTCVLVAGKRCKVRGCERVLDGLLAVVDRC